MYPPNDCGYTYTNTVPRAGSAHTDTLAYSLHLEFKTYHGRTEFVTPSCIVSANADAVLSVGMERVKAAVPAVYPDAKNGCPVNKLEVHSNRPVLTIVADAVLGNPLKMPMVHVVAPRTLGCDTLNPQYEAPTAVAATSHTPCSDGHPNAVSVAHVCMSLDPADATGAT